MAKVVTAGGRGVVAMEMDPTDDADFRHKMLQRTGDFEAASFSLLLSISHR